VESNNPFYLYIFKVDYNLFFANTLFKLLTDFAREYNHKFIMKNMGKSRYIPMASYDHYGIIVFNGMKKLGISQSEETILNKEQLKEMSEIIWH
jgi:hypothetical protein